MLALFETRFFTVLLFSFFLIGCSFNPSYKVGVDSINLSEAMPIKNYVLLPKGHRAESNSLRFKEFSTYVIKALKTKGLTLSDQSKADMLVYLRYEIDGPQTEQYSYAVPNYGQTGFRKVEETSHVETQNGDKKVIKRTKLVPTHGVIGYSSQIRYQTVYKVQIEINAVKSSTNGKSDKHQQLWSTTISVTTKTDDIRHLFPIMIAAAQDYLGENTGRRVYIDLKESDDKVNALRH